MEKKIYIRKRNEHDGKVRSYFAKVRMNRDTSKELASIQGLCYAFGERESLATLFEKVAMPALRRHAKRYAEKARKAKQEGKVR